MSDTKSAMKHTPGPWAVRSQYDNGARIEAENGDGVAWCGADWSSKTGAVPYQANAALIAAAPDLLAACEALMRNPPGWSTADQGDAMDAMLAAITKARGEGAGAGYKAIYVGDRDEDFDGVDVICTEHLKELHDALAAEREKVRVLREALARIFTVLADVDAEANRAAQPGASALSSAPMVRLLRAYDAGRDALAATAPRDTEGGATWAPNARSPTTSTSPRS